MAGDKKKKKSKLGTSNWKDSIKRKKKLHDELNKPASSKWKTESSWIAKRTDGGTADKTPLKRNGGDKKGLKSQKGVTKQELSSESRKLARKGSKGFNTKKHG